MALAAGNARGAFALSNHRAPLADAVELPAKQRDLASYWRPTLNRLRAHCCGARRINGEKKMVVELRIYHCAPGRLPALLDRFQNTTLDFFEQYGIRQVGFWTTLIGPDNHVLTYLLQWESLAEREQKWNAFQADPEWIAKRAASEVEKPIVTRIESQFLTPTAFSALR
jgi:hypothetical protein